MRLSGYHVGPAKSYRVIIHVYVNSQLRRKEMKFGNVKQIDGKELKLLRFL